MKTLAIVLGVVIVLLIGILIFWPTSPKSVQISEKAAVVPAPIVSSDGHVSVTAPSANAVVASPVTIQGTVMSGGWFFEGTFPVKVLDNDGTVLGSGAAQAQGDWTSTAPVPFVATIQFSAPRGSTGEIVLSKDNPSGNPANDLSLIIPVRFR